MANLEICDLPNEVVKTIFNKLEVFTDKTTHLENYRLQPISLKGAGIQNS